MTSLNPITKSDSSTSSLVTLPSPCDLGEVIVTLAAALLLIISLSLSLYYAIHPIPPMIQITADFALCLPFLICSSISIGLLLVLLVQIYRNQSVIEAFSRVEHALVRANVHMGARPAEETVAHYEETHRARIEYTETIVGNRVSFKTRDGVQLSGYWYESTSVIGKRGLSTYAAAPTVLLFHGNQGSATTMTDWGSYYKQLGFNVLMVEYRGYGLSEGRAGGPDQELEAYLDAEAALEFVLLKRIAKRNVIAHGLSLGGAYAAALGYFFGVEHIILDHTFTTLGAICDNWVPFGSWNQHISSSYAQTKLEKHPIIPGAQDLVTDGFNTLAKVQQMKGKVLIICGKQDRMMPLCFGQELMQARYPDDPNRERDYLITLEGGHNYDLELFIADREAKQKHWAFLYTIGTWDRLQYAGLVDWDLLCAQGKARFQEGNQGFVF